MLTAFQAPAATVPVTLCVGVVPLQQSIGRGQAVQWEVGAWTEGGNVPDARVQLQSTAGAGAPAFTFGCAAGNGTSACDLGAVDSGAAQRLFLAAVSVPLTTSLNAVSLTVSASAAGLATIPAASASVTLSAPGTPAAGVSSPVLPGISAGGNAFPSPTMSPGGDAAGLFPALAPSATPAAPSAKAGKESPAANVSALHNGGSPGGMKVADAVGLGALTVAVFLALTRMSFRRPVPRPAAGSPAAAAPPPAATTAFTTSPAPVPPPAPQARLRRRLSRRRRPPRRRRPSRLSGRSNRIAMVNIEVTEPFGISGIDVIAQGLTTKAYWPD